MVMLAKTKNPDALPLKQEVEQYEGSWAQCSETRPAPKVDARLAEFRRLHPEVKGDVFRVGPAGDAFDRFCAAYVWANGTLSAWRSWANAGVDTFEAVFAAVEGR